MIFICSCGKNFEPIKFDGDLHYALDFKETTDGDVVPMAWGNVLCPQCGNRIELFAKLEILSIGTAEERYRKEAEERGEVYISRSEREEEERLFNGLLGLF